jgi:hypothetical protein
MDAQRMTNDLAALSDAATKAYITALGAYNGALIRLHRSGDLVLIDREGMRDKSATSIHGVLSRANVTAYLDMPVETAGWCADAAIAAILGEG